MIVIIDYGIGNTGSVVNALNKLGIKNTISSNPSVIKKATGLILPGVGAAGQGMKNLKKRNLDRILIDEIKNGKPFLGICLGMQLLFEKSEEGNVVCLGIFKGTVNKFKKERKVPQIGWNNVRIINNELRIMNGIKTSSYFYFVNSYYCKPDDTSIIAGKTTYGETFASIVAKENIVGVQFHPEKSGSLGFKLLENFMRFRVEPRMTKKIYVS